MSGPTGERIARYYAETYDVSVPDWPGEIGFYREMAAEAMRRGLAVLEIACGTGRVAHRLAEDGARVVGLDVSPEMLGVARKRSAGLSNIRWVEGDMRSFDLGEAFGLVTIPGHSFHNLNTSEDQAACLECIRRHLAPGGSFALHLDHQDMGWLGDLTRDKGGVFEPAGEFRHPRSGRLVRASQAWRYEPGSQTAISLRVWEELDDGGKVVARRESEPHRLHCIFRFEVEHLLARVGFEVEAVYGDFFRQPLRDDSPEMIWVCTRDEA